ncbi:hypothetical protein FQA39_LY18979 [Lamprigera yunnana]|nr:hypothetical protein FQA39_LY18979 [Lamprigera yunnana]
MEKTCSVRDVTLSESHKSTYISKTDMESIKELTDDEKTLIKLRFDSEKNITNLLINKKDDSDEDMVHASDDNTTDDETLSPQVIAYLEEEETVDELNLSLTEVCYSPLKFHALGECSSELLMLNRN